jgi:hypothetical protein
MSFPECGQYGKKAVLPLLPSYKLDHAAITHRSFLVMQNIQFWNE